MSELKKEIFQEHKGMVTAQSDFNQDPDTASWLRNTFIMDNGTRRKIQGTTQINNNLPDKPVHNVIAYVSINGKTEWLVQVANEWWRIEQDRTATLIQELSDTQRHGYTHFNGRLIVGNTNQPAYKYFYMKNPGDPITENLDGGSDSGEPARTYWVRIAYDGKNGKTEASRTVRQDVESGNYLKVSVPPDQEGADGWSVYVSQTKGEENLQKENLGMNTDYTEKDHGIVNDTGTAGYPTENTAWEWKAVGGNPPLANYWHTHNSRVFCTGIQDDEMEIRYSKLNDEDSWSVENTNADGSGALEFDLEFSEGDIARGIASLQNRIIFFFEDHIAIYVFGTDHTKISREQIMEGKGCVDQSSIINIGGDVLWLSKYGVESLSQEFGSENLLYDDDNPSSAINNVLAEDTQEVIRDGNEHLLESGYYPLRNWVIFQIPTATGSGDVMEQRWWLFDMDLGEWSFMDGVTARSFGVDREEKLYAGTKGEVVEVFDGTWDRNGNSYDMEWTTPWIYLEDPSVKKNLKFILLPLESDKATELTLTIVTDMGEAITEQQNVTLGVQDDSKWNVARWSDGQFSDTVKEITKIPIQAVGRAFKFVFEHSDDADLRIPWYEILYQPGSER